MASQPPPTIPPRPAKLTPAIPPRPPRHASRSRPDASTASAPATPEVPARPEVPTRPAPPTQTHSAPVVISKASTVISKAPSATGHVGRCVPMYPSAGEVQAPSQSSTPVAGKKKHVYREEWEMNEGAYGSKRRESPYSAFPLPPPPPLSPPTKTP